MSSSKKVMLINADHPEECRAVILDNGKLDDIIIEHSSRELVKGNIYWGVITRIEPAIEAAFVDFGGKKFGFLPFKDVLRESYLPTREKKAKLRIQDVLVRGQKLLVQVVKESRDAKGPSLTNAITIPGRFLVLMCSSESTGISRKIEDETERKKLKEILSDLGLPDHMGVIIRTAGLGRTKAELQKDVQMLLKIWENIQATIKNPETKAPCLLYEGPDMVVRTVRDHFSNDTSEVIIDNPKSYRAVKEFIKMTMPRMRNRVKLYQDTKPLFSQYGVEEQIESIFKRNVSLPSGGSIVIDVCEAMVAIDVNSGKTTSASELEETALRTNLEAAEEISRQLRLRDLGGLIVIDFIDMFQKKNKSQVEKHLKQSCKVDKARINISRISRFGLLEMSRQRMSPPVREGIFENCKVCDGTGYVRTTSNLALGVIRKIQENIAAGGVKVLEVEISTAVANYLLNNKAKNLVDLQDKHGVTVRFVSKEDLPLESFNYTVVERKRDEEKREEQKRDGGRREVQREKRESRTPRARRGSRVPKEPVEAAGPASNDQPVEELVTAPAEPVDDKTADKSESKAGRRGRGRRPAGARGRPSRRSSGPRRSESTARRRSRVTDSDNDSARVDTSPKRNEGGMTDPGRAGPITDNPALDKKLEKVASESSETGENTETPSKTETKSDFHKNQEEFTQKDFGLEPLSHSSPPRFGKEGARNDSNESNEQDTDYNTEENRLDF